jgi:orotidine-5'-phosphate decarboxylase
MQRSTLIQQIKEKKSFLCVGLDTDANKIPGHLTNQPDGIFAFNKAIIDATKDHCVSYKINTAFYEAMGSKGWDIMAETVSYIPSSHLKIADAKRADIGNTSSYYAKAFFETIPFDAITVAPYMGEDSIRPFLEYENKWTIVLGLTSNPGAKDFEMLKLQGEKEWHVYEQVLQTVSKWGNPEKLMFVTGATQATALKEIRKIVPDHFLLVPGVGAQGGSLQEVVENGINDEIGLLVNASRAILYAGNDADFATAAQKVAAAYQTEMSTYLQA